MPGLYGTQKKQKGKSKNKKSKMKKVGKRGRS